MIDPAELTLAEAADAVQKRNLSSLELLDACFANIERANGDINATICLDYEGARKSARKADEGVKNGAKLGRLHGVPMAHKDMYYQKGKLCTCGSRIRKDFVPDVTATVLARMDAAGVYSFGRLNTGEFAANGTGHNSEFGVCRKSVELGLCHRRLVLGVGCSSGRAHDLCRARIGYRRLDPAAGGGLWRYRY